MGDVTRALVTEESFPRTTFELVEVLASSSESPQTPGNVRRAVELLEPALLAAHGSGEPVVGAWMRSVPNEVLRVLVAGAVHPVSELGDLDRLSLPLGATARRIDRCTLAGYLEPFACWVPCSGAFDPLSAEQDDSSHTESGGDLEEVFAHLATEPVAWVTVARPVDSSELHQLMGRLAHRMPTLRNRAGSTEGYRIELEREEAWYRELSTAEAAGMWQIEPFVGAVSPGAASRAAALLCGSRQVRLSPYRLRRVSGEEATRAEAGEEPAARFWATSRLLAALIRPPVRDVPGIRVCQRPDFDLTPESDGCIRLGDILDENLLPCGRWSVGERTLNRHTFVSGATGSGKSQTVRTLLERLSTAHVPWLVVEPAKSEYARMAGRLDPERNLLALRPGAPDRIPASLNPLEPEPGFPLQSHVDLVRALFLAAFEADEPFPQVLAAALLRCYQERGWDLALGEPAADWPGIKPPRWPTLADVQVIAKKVVTDIGYGREVADNVRGFVDVRIGSLRLGSPGLFFEGGHPLDVGCLLEQNVVVELDPIANDADKAFIIGLLVIRLVEHLRVHRSALSDATKLQHVTVIEEAHRLLRRQGEDPSPAARAVEIFADLLAEVRAYGEGIVVAEQIPAKIVPDVVKNSALKIMHRLPAADDRDFVGATMNLADAQSRYVVTLRPGTAAVFSDGMDRPLLVTVDLGESREGGTPRVVPPLRESRSRLCGPICSEAAHTACTLRDIRRAESIVDAHPALVVWVEAEVAAHLIGGGLGLGPPMAPWLADVADTGQRAVQCAVAAAVDAAIDNRYTLLREFYDPLNLGHHLTNRIAALLLGEDDPSGCTADENDWQAGQRRWVDIIAALQDPDLDPERQHPLTAKWEAERGVLVRGASLAEQLAGLRARSTYPRQRELYLGPSPSRLDAAANRLSAAGTARDRLIRALERTGLDTPTWLLDRIHPRAQA